MQDTRVFQPYDRLLRARAFVDQTLPFDSFGGTGPRSIRVSLSRRPSLPLPACLSLRSLCQANFKPRGTAFLELNCQRLAAYNEEQTSERSDEVSPYLTVSCTRVPVRKFPERLPTAWAY